MWFSLFHMFNISFIACIKEVHWSWESRRPDSVWAGVDNRFCTYDLIKENTWMIIHEPKKSWLHYMHQFVLSLNTSICFALYALNHSLYIIKMILRFKQSQQCARFPNRTIRLKNITWSSLHDQHALCLGRVDHTWLI